MMADECGYYATQTNAYERLYRESQQRVAELEAELANSRPMATLLKKVGSTVFQAHVVGPCVILLFVGIMTSILVMTNEQDGIRDKEQCEFVSRVVGKPTAYETKMKTCFATNKDGTLTPIIPMELLVNGKSNGEGK